MRITTSVLNLASVLAISGIGAAQLEPSWVHFDSDGISIAANLYIPSSNASVNATSGRRPAIVVGHPHGELRSRLRVSMHGSWSKLLASLPSRSMPLIREKVVECLVILRIPTSALTMFVTSTLSSVDPQRIGVLGVCASGGYVPFAAQTDQRMKAVATISGIDLGTMYSEGFGSFNGPMLPSIREQLAEANRQRFAEAQGTPPNFTRIFPNTISDVTPQLPVFYQESYSYYQTPRGHVRTAPNWHLWRSLDIIATYRSYTYMDLIYPRPLLMIAGSDGDTLYMSQRAIDIAKEPKELFLVPGRTHIDLYDHTDVSLPNLVDFSTKHL